MSSSLGVRRLKFQAQHMERLAYLAAVVAIEAGDGSSGHGHVLRAEVVRDIRAELDLARYDWRAVRAKAQAEAISRLRGEKR